MAIVITFEGDGLSLKKETTLQKAGQIIAFLGTEENHGQPDSKRNFASPTVLTVGPNLTPGELIIDTKAKTNAEKILVLGNYLIVKDNAENFSTKDVLNELKKVGGEPHNFARDLRTAVSLNYIYAVDAKQGTYGVSHTGKQAIQNKFSNKTRARIRGKSTGGKKIAVPPRAEVVSMPKVATLDGFPDFHKLPAKSDSILWALAYATNQNIEDLTPREIEVITDSLLNRVAHKDFSAHNKRNMKAGYISKNNGRFKLQQKGIAYLKGIDAKEPHDKE